MKTQLQNGFVYMVLQRPYRTIAKIENKYGKVIGILNQPKLLGGEEVVVLAKQFEKEHPELLEARNEL